MVWSLLPENSRLPKGYFIRGEDTNYEPFSCLICALFAVSRLLEENTLSEHFMTAYYAVLALDTGTFLYANAGHPPPRWWRAALGTVETVPDCAGPPLGIGLADTYCQASIRFGPGDILVFFTDGLVEARSRPHGAFGITRLDTAILVGLKTVRLVSAGEHW